MKAKELNCTFLQEGDILVARMPYPLGRATLFPLKGEHKYITVVDVAIIRLNKDFVIPAYFKYNLNSPISRHKIEKLKSGTTRKRISRKNLSNIRFSFAPLPEQRAIVAKIEELFSELDSGIDSLKKAKDQLEVYRQAVLKSAFEGRLTHSEVEGWQRTSFNKLIKNISISKNKVKQRDYLLEGKYPVIDQGQELIGGYIDNEEKVVECNLPVIVFGDHTKTVKYVNFEFAPGGDGTKIFETERGIRTKYLYYLILFLSKKIKDRGYARHYQYLKKEKILLAPLPDQEEIIKEIESRLSVCENIEANIDEALEKSEALRQSVLKKAFEGKLLSNEELEACKQEDDWEPAEKLLKRIKETKKEAKNNVK
ncbi:MAG TPA: restriction endonuclease subunit S, partial [Candidatus Cloacimonadota bacterium]|nr:restriction endonuclease subunit S [Candidatus Cloacimonadota bacterium]